MCCDSPAVCWCGTVLAQTPPCYLSPLPESPMPRRTAWVSRHGTNREVSTSRQENETENGSTHTCLALNHQYHDIPCHIPHKSVFPRVGKPETVKASTERMDAFAARFTRVFHCAGLSRAKATQSLQSPTCGSENSPHPSVLLSQARSRRKAVVHEVVCPSPACTTAKSGAVHHCTKRAKNKSCNIATCTSMV